VFLSILFSIVGDRISAAFASARTDPAFLAAAAQNPDFAGGGGLDLNNTEFLKTLDPALARPILSGFAGSLDTVFLVGGITVLVAFALIWFLKEVPLSTKSGIERAADEEAASAEPVPVAMH
jgi:hypothetical protein